MHDHRAGYCGSWANEQGRKILLDPGERTPVCLLRSRVIVEHADRSHSVIGCIDHILGHEAFNLTDDRNSTFLNSARELFGRASLCSSLTNGAYLGLSFIGQVAKIETARSFIAKAASSINSRALNITLSSVWQPNRVMANRWHDLITMHRAGASLRAKRKHVLRSEFFSV